jgi:hypothetical protein
MQVVMDALKDKNLYFVDSKTIGSSVAGRVAWATGIRTGERDVFLDHEDNITFVRSALRKTENAAKQKGYAIAIGHPKNATIQGLREWLPTLEAKGFEIVPASALVRRADKGVKIPPPEVAPQDDAPQEVLNQEQESLPEGLYFLKTAVANEDHEPVVIDPQPLKDPRAPDLLSIPQP